VERLLFSPDPAALALADPVVGVALALPAVLVVLGALLVLVGLHRTWVRWHFVQQAAPATAQVVRVVEERRKKAARYFADLTFTPPGASAPVLFRSSLSTDDPLFAEGQQVPIRYLPKQPTHAFIDDFWHLWFWPVFLVSVGVLMAGLGAWVLRDMLVGIPATA
jgi:hypothetical protein